jgi:hypothetical protein
MARGRSSQTNNRQPSPGRGKATARQTRLATLLRDGTDIEPAMLEAGYGPGVVASLSTQLPGILEDLGLDIGSAKSKPAAKKSAGAEDESKE